MQRGSTARLAAPVCGRLFGDPCFGNDNTNFLDKLRHSADGEVENELPVLSLALDLKRRSMQGPDARYFFR